jgi:hypothetical protein
MTWRAGRFLAALAALALAGGVVDAYAAGSPTGVLVDGMLNKEPPKDCKAKPEDPRCKDKKD